MQVLNKNRSPSPLAESEPAGRNRARAELARKSDQDGRESKRVGPDGVSHDGERERGLGGEARGAIYLLKSP